MRLKLRLDSNFNECTIFAVSSCDTFRFALIPISMSAQCGAPYQSFPRCFALIPISMSAQSHCRSPV